MAHFLKGKYRGLYKCGPSECVRDVFRFRQYKETSLQMEYAILTIPFSLLIIFYNYRLSRRDLDTRARRFWRYENSFFTLIPVDET